MTEYDVVNQLVLVTLCAVVALFSVHYGFRIGSLDNKKKDYVAFFLIFAHLGYAYWAMNSGDMAADAIPSLIFAVVFTAGFYLSSKHHEKLLAYLEELHRKERLEAFR